MARIVLVLSLVAIVSVWRLSGAPMPAVDKIDPIPEHHATESTPQGSSSGISIISSSTPLTITGTTSIIPNCAASPFYNVSSTSATVPCTLEVR